ncbi:MAG: metal-dependent hydrolase [Candidatus Hodarchaeota archaeon]
MYPLAHIGIPLFIAEIIGCVMCTSTMNYPRNDFQNKNWSQGRFELMPMAFGCLLPDLLDKTLGQLLFASGRSLSHTLVFCTICSVIFFLFQSRKAGISFFLGAVSHLILDIPGVPWFWPITPSEFAKTESALMNLEWLFNPITLTFELLGLGLLVFLGQRYRMEIFTWSEARHSLMVPIFQNRD